VISRPDGWPAKPLPCSRGRYRLTR
jgi:hypothetical protein